MINNAACENKFSSRQSRSSSVKILFTHNHNKEFIIHLTIISSKIYISKQHRALTQEILSHD
jgi:hypothetical protein